MTWTPVTTSSTPLQLTGGKHLMFVLYLQNFYFTLVHYITKKNGSQQIFSSGSKVQIFTLTQLMTGQRERKIDSSYLCCHPAKPLP
jgi:hypothetical protein